MKKISKYFKIPTHNVYQIEEIFNELKFETILKTVFLKTVREKVRKDYYFTELALKMYCAVGSVY